LECHITAEIKVHKISFSGRLQTL